MKERLYEFHHFQKPFRRNLTYTIVVFLLLFGILFLLNQIQFENPYIQDILNVTNTAVFFVKALVFQKTNNLFISLLVFFVYYSLLSCILASSLNKVKIVLLLVILGYAIYKNIIIEFPLYDPYWQ